MADERYKPEESAPGMALASLAGNLSEDGELENPG